MVAFQLSFPSKRSWALIALLWLLNMPSFAQPGRGNWGGANNAQRNIGRFYGKVVDENGKGVGYAAVQLYGKTFDRASRSMKDTLLAGQITEDNGDFSLENLPVRGNFTLKISFLGYADIEQEVTFGIPGREPGQGRPGGGRPGGRPESSQDEERDTTESQSERQAPRQRSGDRMKWSLPVKPVM